MTSVLATGARVATAGLALLMLGLGVWAMASPHGFFETAASYPPYNAHFIRDIGSFLILAGSSLVAGLILRDALLAVLTGSAIGSTAHFVSHVVDGLDPLAFAILAILPVVLAGARYAVVRR